MMTDNMLPVIVVGLIALLIGSLLGLWIGVGIEQRALVDIITHAEISQDCRLQLNEAVQAIIGDWEGTPSP